MQVLISLLYRKFYTNKPLLNLSLRCLTNIAVHPLLRIGAANLSGLLHLSLCRRIMEAKMTALLSVIACSRHE